MRSVLIVQTQSDRNSRLVLHIRNVSAPTLLAYGRDWQSRPAIRVKSQQEVTRHAKFGIRNGFAWVNGIKGAPSSG